MNVAANLWSRWGLGKSAQESDALPVRLGRRANYANTQSTGRVSSLDHALIAVVCTLLWATRTIISWCVIWPPLP